MSDSGWVPRSHGWRLAEMEARTGHNPRPTDDADLDDHKFFHDCKFPSDMTSSCVTSSILDHRSKSVQRLNVVAKTKQERDAFSASNNVPQGACFVLSGHKTR